MSKFNLIVEPNHALTNISIFDGTNNLVAKDESVLNVPLSKGLYTVRTELNGVVDEQVIRHTKTQTINPKIYFNSVVPFNDSKYSHEYYSYPAEQQSNKFTFGPIGDLNQEGRMFLFVRNIDMSYAQEHVMSNMLQGFSLLDQNLNEIVDLSSEGVETDSDHGWAAFSVQIQSGTYYLKYKGGRSRIIPIYIAPDLQTQVFLMRMSEPNFRSMRIFMSKDGFDMNDEVSLRIDAAVTALQTGDYEIPKSLFHYLINEKFENPILGFLGAYIFLKSNRVDKESLLDTVVNNMERILGREDCPDLEVLKLLLARKFNRTIPDYQFNHLPMFRVGLETVIEESIYKEDLLLPNSIIGQIADNTLQDSPWSSWVIKKDERKLISGFKFFFKNKEVQLSKIDHVIDDLKEWIVPSILEAVSESERKGTKLTIQSLSRDLGLPIQTIKNKLGYWSPLVNDSDLIGEFIDRIETRDINKKGGFGKFVGIVNNLLDENDDQDMLKM